MPRVHRTIAMALATLALTVASACSYDSAITDLECENQGEIDGNRICQQGIWVERASGDVIEDDTGLDAEQDVTPPQDTGDVDPPQDTSDTSDTTTDDTTDTTVDDATDTTDTTDTTIDDATDTTDTTVDDASDTTVDDASDTVDPDSGDIGGPCVTPMTVTSNPALGYWPLDMPNASGEYPHAGSAPFGPAVPSSAQTADPTNVTGKTGNAVQMDGQNDYLEIDHHPQMLLSQGTVTFWMKADDVNHTQGLWSKDADGSSAGGHLTLELRGNQTLHVRLQSNQANYTIQSGVLPSNQWIHVALLFGPTNSGRDSLELYIDGVSVASNPYDGGLDSNLQGERAKNQEPIGLGVTTTTWDSATPGAWPDSTEELQGTLDEIGLFDQRLTPREIQKLAQNPCN